MRLPTQYIISGAVALLLAILVSLILFGDTDLPSESIHDPAATHGVSLSPTPQNAVLVTPVAEPDSQRKADISVAVTNDTRNQRREITPTTSDLDGNYFFLAVPRNYHWDYKAPAISLARFRGDHPALHEETRECTITKNYDSDTTRSVIYSADRDWPFTDIRWPLNGLLAINSLNDRSHANPTGGIILTLDKGDIEIIDCGEFTRIPALTMMDTIKEDGVYLTGSFVGHYGEGRETEIIQGYDHLVGTIQYGTYINSGDSALSMCMVLKISSPPEVAVWHPLGYGRLLLSIDASWEGVATSGCGDWIRLADSEWLDEKLTFEEIKPDEKESVWDYCARIGSTELVYEDLPPDISSQLREITFHPMNGITGPYVYEARCGYVEDNETPTLLLCQPHSWGGLGRSTKWSPPTNGAMPPRTPCFFNEYQSGDSSDSLFTAEMIERVCNGEGHSLGINWSGLGCAEAYADHLETGEEEWVDIKHFRSFYGSEVANLFRGSYITGQDLHLRLKYRSIDRDGYFSLIWHPVPEGCTGFETVEVGRGSFHGGWTDPLLFTLREKCISLGIMETETAWEIPDGKVLLPERILTGAGH